MLLFSAIDPILLQHNLDPAETGVPGQLRCSCTFMQSDGVYLLGEKLNVCVYSC